MKKLLVVDDDNALRRLMRLELSDEFEVVDSGQPEEGLALALVHKPEAILLDLRMPKYSGYELLQTFTSFSRTQAIPVIIVSGEAGGQTREQCKQLGAAGYFEKPIDFEGLRQSLRQIPQTRRYIPRAEVRVKLRVPLKLRGKNVQGEAVEAQAVTDNVSLSGFLCSSTAEFSVESILEVYLTSCGTTLAGKAKVVHCDAKSAPLRHYGCRFIEKGGPWVLE